MPRGHCHPPITKGECQEKGGAEATSFVVSLKSAGKDNTGTKRVWGVQGEAVRGGLRTPSDPLK